MSISILNFLQRQRSNSKLWHQKLELKEIEAHQSIRRAKDNTKKLEPTVVDWLKRVEDVKKDAHTISKGMVNVKVDCFCNGPTSP